VDPERDAFEFALVKAAQAQGKPILGICRGSQVLAVAFGAVLCQHLPDITELTHDSDTPPPARAHPVRLEPPLELETLLRSHGIGETLEVNSYHHQGVPRRADLPPLLQPIAEAPDGVVEGFLWRSASEMIGALAVQWHPELLFEDDARHLWPFHWLVEAAQGAR
jgi:putative glutamine amidotransferase